MAEQDRSRIKAADKQKSDPQREAWLTAFFIENHLDHCAYPEKAAPDEQIRFMVYTDKERYYPCSDTMFEAIIERNRSAFLQTRYNRVLERILNIVDHNISDHWQKNYLEALIAMNFKHETRDELLLPSRLEKRLLTVFLKQTQIDDPFIDEKTVRNNRAKRCLDAPGFRAAFDAVDTKALKKVPASLSEIKSIVGAVEFKRLLTCANEPAIWLKDEALSWSKEEFIKIFQTPVSGKGFDPLLEFLGFKGGSNRRKRILWIADEAGQFVLDIALIKILVSWGHKVLIAIKQSPLFTKVSLEDVSNDEVLSGIMEDVPLIEDPAISKNDLLRLLGSDDDILLFGDGTGEKLNLILTSTTFARVFKEVDGVISRGLDQRSRFFDTHFQFTQDIFSIARDQDGRLSVLYKPRHPAVIKFSQEDLEAKAQTIIDQMKAAKKRGMTVMFYSGIIGSLPGKINIAKKVMTTFIEHLKKQAEMTFIINPSEYYEPGMDADDLMYMWEIVQRSGLIDIWRFQTFDDIVTAFQIMGSKVPPEWVGKDATYSTGCTKEMQIAMDVQQQHPEMQIIGPAREKFMRRKEYGVGLMYDSRLRKY